jgi:hypothetical protein
MNRRTQLNATARPACWQGLAALPCRLQVVAIFGKVGTATP